MQTLLRRVVGVVGTMVVGLSLACIPSLSASASPAALCSTTLQEGSSGICVTQLQQRLNQLGANLVVDGQFGPATKNAVLAFQGRERIGFDGIVSSQTQSYLNNPGSVNLN